MSICFHSQHFHALAVHSPCIIWLQLLAQLMSMKFVSGPTLFFWWLCMWTIFTCFSGDHYTYTYIYIYIYIYILNCTATAQPLHNYYTSIAALPVAHPLHCLLSLHCPLHHRCYTTHCSARCTFVALPTVVALLTAPSSLQGAAGLRTLLLQGSYWIAHTAARKAEGRLLTAMELAHCKKGCLLQRSWWTACTAIACEDEDTLLLTRMSRLLVRGRHRCIEDIGSCSSSTTSKI